jgi:hypothetical protein
MSTVIAPKIRWPIPRRASEVRATWSPHERQQRAMEGRRRFQEFLSLICNPDPSHNIWAVGAPAGVDLQRVAGQR